MAKKKAAPEKKTGTHITGNIGMYYVCHQLSRLGLNVMPTARNARGIDIVAYNEDITKFVSIQVKTLSTKTPVPLGNTLDKILGDFWVIVNNVKEEPNVFVMRPKEVKDGASRNEKNGNVSYWLNLKDYDKRKYAGKWNRILKRLGQTSDA